MERILEPEYMDTPEEASEYEAMDHTAANAAVVADLHAAGGTRGRILDLGTGPADIPVLLLREHPGITGVVAVDAAGTMLELARRKVATAGLTDRIRLERADVKALPFADGSFDTVFSNTILHHIPEPRDLLAEAWRTVAPGGLLWVRDLLRPGSEAEARALVDLHAAGANERQRRLLYDSLHAALNPDEARACAAACGIAGAGVVQTSDRHYTLQARKEGD